MGTRYSAKKKWVEDSLYSTWPFDAVLVLSFAFIALIAKSEGIDGVCRPLLKKVLDNQVSPYRHLCVLEFALAMKSVAGYGSLLLADEYVCVYDSDGWSLNLRLGIVIALRLLARAVYAEVMQAAATDAALQIVTRKKRSLCRATRWKRKKEKKQKTQLETLRRPSPRDFTTYVFSAPTRSYPNISQSPPPAPPSCPKTDNDLPQYSPPSTPPSYSSPPSPPTYRRPDHPYIAST